MPHAWPSQGGPVQMCIRLLNLRQVPHVTLSGMASAAECGTELTSLRELGTRGMVSVCGMWTTWNWFTFRRCHVGRFSTILTNHDVGLYGLAFTRVPLDFPRVVPSDRSLMNEDVLAVIVPIDETVFILDVKPLNGSENSFDKAVLHLLELPWGIPLPSQTMAFNWRFDRVGLNELAPLFWRCSLNPSGPIAGARSMCFFQSKLSHFLVLNWPRLVVLRMISLSSHDFKHCAS